MAVNQAEADKEIRSQLVSTLESGHNHMALGEATKAFPTSAINSRLPRFPTAFGIWSSTYACRKRTCSTI
jgi:hypothetical protein